MTVKILEEKYPEYEWYNFNDIIFYGLKNSDDGYATDILGLDTSLHEYVKGTFKWDGCCNLSTEPSHYCGIHDVYLYYEVMKEAYSKVSKSMDKWRS